MSDTTAWQLGALVQPGEPVKFYAQYGSNDNKTFDNTIKMIGLGADYTIGNWARSCCSGTSSVPTSVPTCKTLSVGYDYQMSKRTDLYAVYMNEKLDGPEHRQQLRPGHPPPLLIRARPGACPACLPCNGHPGNAVAVAVGRQRGLPHAPPLIQRNPRRAGLREHGRHGQVSGSRRGRHRQHRQARSAWNTATPPPPDTPA